nr:MAG TPA: hypothetical protein [Caudoviricetes sp.]
MTDGQRFVIYTGVYNKAPVHYKALPFRDGLNIYVRPRMNRRGNSFNEYKFLIRLPFDPARSRDFEYIYQQALTYTKGL